jgi:hypothetical protein
VVEGVSGKTEKKASFTLIKVPSLRSMKVAEDEFLACILTLTEKKFIIGVQEGWYLGSFEAYTLSPYLSIC